MAASLRVKDRKEVSGEEIGSWWEFTLFKEEWRFPKAALFEGLSMPFSCQFILNSFL
jgi:hypothetical protein